MEISQLENNTNEARDHKDFTKFKKQRNSLVKRDNQYKRSILIIDILFMGQNLFEKLVNLFF